MKTIVVATDFSERSDRAIRRATLLAREFESKLHLVHVVDDDQPQLIVQAQRDAATKLLWELTHTLETVDALKCDFHVVLGDPFIGIIKAARNIDADLIVIGPHRRQLLRDILMGTTAERTIRTADRPVLLANGVPTASYRRAIVATDLSDYSGVTIHTVISLGLLDHVNVSLLNVYSDPGSAMLSRASLSDDAKESYLAGEQNRARSEVASFMDRINVDGMSTIVKPPNANIAATICDAANETSTDLIVIGTCGRSVFARMLMGSVPEGVLRDSDRDVLAIPPPQNEPA